MIFFASRSKKALKSGYSLSETALFLICIACLKYILLFLRLYCALKFIQGLSNAEIAEITGRSPEAIRVLQFRALMALRKTLDRQATGDGDGA